jgi:prepilin-type N-terminal cleavage/methylation domain-containing protein/prepilin-type processing-associated H-X9-DG protein
MSRPMRSKKRVSANRTGFTIVELLVVIAILTIVIGLLSMAVQNVREAANRMVCRNNLQQIGLAMRQVDTQTGSYPSGGWGWFWIGVPSRKSDCRQPGGWIYNILPYVDQADLRKLGTNDATLSSDMVRLVQSTVKFVNCPSRRTGGPWPGNGNSYYIADSNGNTSTITPGVMARTDYAANCGSDPADENNAGPSSVNDPAWQSPSFNYTGVIYLRSYVRQEDITRGLSNVFLVGERYLNPLNYFNGQDGADNESMYVGFDNDLYRSAYYAPGDPTTYDPSNPGSSYYPMRDNAALPSNTFRYGSPHQPGFHMVYCDGHVDTIAYDVDMRVFAAGGTRFSN